MPQLNDRPSYVATEFEATLVSLISRLSLLDPKFLPACAGGAKTEHETLVELLSKLVGQQQGNTSTTTAGSTAPTDGRPGLTNGAPAVPSKPTTSSSGTTSGECAPPSRSALLILKWLRSWIYN